MACSKIEYIIDGKYVTKVYTGPVTKQCILESWNYMIKHVLNRNTKCIISDFTNSIFSHGKNDLEKLGKGLLEYKDIIYDLHLVQIVDHTKILLTTMFYIKHPNFISRPFRTVEQAKLWVEHRLNIEHS